MRLVGYILAACLALALMRVMAQIAVIAATVAVIVLVINRPRETAGLILLLVTVGLAGRYPAHAAFVMAVTFLLGIVHRR